MSRALKIIVIVLSVLLAIVLLSSIAGHITLTTYLSNKLGRNVSASFVYANPITGAVYVRNLCCGDLEGDTAFAEMRSLSARVNPYALIVRKANIRNIELNGLTLNIVNQDSCFNFSDIPSRFVSVDGDSTRVRKPWGVVIKSISLDDAAVLYSNPTRNVSWQLNGINLTVPGIDLDPQHKNAGISLELPDDAGTATVDGHYDEHTKRLMLDLKVDKINPQIFLPIIKQKLNIVDFKATLSADLKADGTLDDIMATHFNGTLQITDFDLRDEWLHSVATCKRMSISVKDISLKTMQIDVDEFVIDSLALDVKATRDGNTLTKLWEQEQKDIKTESPTYNGVQLSTDNLRVRVGNLNIAHSSIVYEDKTLPSNFKYTISGITALGKEIDTRSTTNHIILNGNLPEGGSVMLKWQGGLNPNNSTCHVVGMLRHVKLRLLSPWTLHIFGYAISAGMLNFTSDNTIAHGKLNSSSSIEIVKPEVGKKRRRGTPLIDVPLKLGVGLMKNANNDIMLNVLVNGDMNRSGFHLTDEIGKAVGQAVKEAISPSQSKPQKKEKQQMPQQRQSKQVQQQSDTQDYAQPTAEERKQHRQEQREERRKRREEKRKERKNR